MERKKEAKEYFANDFLADDIIRPLNHDLVREILKLKPKSVFEFGCGQGKNLELLKEMNPLLEVNGCDISRIAVEQAIRRGRAEFVFEGDEEDLSAFVGKFTDVAFTCSVLDHVPEDKKIEQIVEDLKRISKKGVILYETLRDDAPVYYYPHDYEAMGFVRNPPDYSYFSDADGSTYYMWKWIKKK